MSSSGKGQAGVVLAQKLTNAGFAMQGITASDAYDDVPKRTAKIANDTAQALGLDLLVAPGEILNDRNFVGEGYGIPTEVGLEAVRLFARQEGIVLDPVYTGKAAAGMIAHIRAGRYRPDDAVVFVHTGGSPAIFTWSELFVQPDTAAAG